MLIYIMRHGDAVGVGGEVRDDASRHLSPRGEQDVQNVAAALKRRGETITAIAASPLRRAQQTAKLVADAFDIAEVHTAPALAPSLSWPGLKSLLNQKSAEPGILLAFHHPDVTLSIALLAGLDASVFPLFGTASVAALDWNPDPKKAEFLWFQTADQLIRE